ncbi:ATP-grasp domain-containing protein [Streptomyces sp. NPDC001941]|uniref:ATP-grasp domain-containing protein n=1 Tax=Streptomyces sp. NPDC001941 TaxID=3154659 RepID=UPI003318827B
MARRDLLALAPQYTPTAELFAAAARRRGMDVEGLGEQPDSSRYFGRTHYYGGPHFAARTAHRLGVALVEPEDGWLAGLPRTYTGRRITLGTLAQARGLSRPAFVKPPREKSFPAAVYADGTRLPAGAGGPDAPVLISEVVDWQAEFRLYVLDGEVRTGSRYLTYGVLDPAPLEGGAYEASLRRFVADLWRTHGDTLPGAVVLDVGVLGGADRPLAVVEANMAWFSNCYASDPDRALDVVLRAAGPYDRLPVRERKFCRSRDRSQGHGRRARGVSRA